MLPSGPRSRIGRAGERRLWTAAAVTPLSLKPTRCATPEPRVKRRRPTVECGAARRRFAFRTGCGLVFVAVLGVGVFDVPHGGRNGITGAGWSDRLAALRAAGLAEAAQDVVAAAAVEFGSAVELGSQAGVNRNGKDEWRRCQANGPGRHLHKALWCTQSQSPGPGVYEAINWVHHHAHVHDAEKPAHEHADCPPPEPVQSRFRHVTMMQARQPACKPFPPRQGRPGSGFWGWVSACDAPGQHVLR